jgi:predicted RNA-binding protein with PUA-like domain
MALWLFKTEPDCYNFADLRRDGRTVWDGVTNALALKHLRQVRAGDRVWFYHTGNEKAVVGEIVVESADGAGTVVVRPVRPLEHPVTLARIKAEKALAGWELVRLPRLSVVPVTEAQWRRVEELAEEVV